MNYCPNCGKKVTGNFCTNCGYKKTDNHDTKGNDVNRDELLNVFAGKNANKVYNRNWNWSAFIFGPLYYFYRKLWLEGAILALILLLIDIILNYVLYDILGSIASIIYLLSYLAIHIGSSVLFSKLYANKASKKIDLVLAKKMSRENTLLEVQKIGGTASWIAIVAIIIGALVGIIIVIAFIGAIFYSFVWPMIVTDANIKSCEIATCNEDKSYCYTIDEDGNIDWEGSCQN